MKKNLKIKLLSCIFLLVCAAGTSAPYIIRMCLGASVFAGSGTYIKWIDFTPTEAALQDASRADVASYGSADHISWIETLAYLASKNGGNFKKYKKADLDKLLTQAAETGKRPHELASNTKLYDYYFEAYTAVLGGMLGEYTEYSTGADGAPAERSGYGIRVFSPIARGYGYSHYDDFGASRGYGYKRSHLGHDIMGAVGAPIIAVESCYVEAAGWNQYGGWRVGLRSFDGKRYYYYAHMRRGHPYNDIYEGKIVGAGEVIGYLGATGYSVKENVNNITTPHLHLGLQIIFDKSQKDGVNQIWIDMYELTKFLAGNTSRVYHDSAAGEYYAHRYYLYPETPD